MKPLQKNLLTSIAIVYNLSPLAQHSKNSSLKLSLDELKSAKSAVSSEQGFDASKVPNPECSSVLKNIKNLESKKNEFLKTVSNAKAQVLFLGESHGQHATPCLVAKLFKEFNNDGYQTIALEIDDTYQKFFDQFNEANDFEKAFEILVKNKVPLAKFAREDGNVSLVANEFFRKIKESRLKVVAIDHYDDNDAKARDEIMAAHIKDLIKSGKIKLWTQMMLPISTMRKN